MKQNDLLQEAAKLSMTKSLGFVMKFLSGILLARLLGPEGRGLYALLLVVPMIVISFVEFGLKRSTIYHISRQDFPVPKLIGMVLIIFIFSSIIGILATAFIYFKMQNPKITVLLAVLASLSIPVTLLIRLSRSILIGKQEYKKNNLLLLMPNLINLGALLIFVYWQRMNVAGALLSLLLSNVFLASYVIRHVIKKQEIIFSFDKKIFKSLITLGLTYAFAMILVRLNYRIDILLLEYLSDLHEVGYYSLGTSLAEQWQAPFAIGAVIISKTANTNEFAQIKGKILQLARVNFLISLLVFTGIFFLAPFIIPLLYGQKFFNSIEIVQYMLPGIIFLITAKVFGTSLAGMMKTKYVIWVFFLALIVNIGLNFYFIPKFGGLGAAISTNISYALGALGVIVVFCMVTKTSFGELIIFKKDDLRFLLKRIRGMRKPS